VVVREREKDFESHSTIPALFYIRLSTRQGEFFNTFPLFSNRLFGPEIEEIYKRKLHFLVAKSVKGLEGVWLLVGRGYFLCYLGI
jgi:hypothetical protein